MQPYPKTCQNLTGECRLNEYKDASAVAEFLSSVLEQNWSEQDITDYIKNPSRHLLSYYEESTLVAFILFDFIIDEVEIIGCGVWSKYQNRKIAYYLFEELFSVCKQQGAKRVFLDVAESNEKAIGLYRKLGFGELRRRKHYYQLSTGETDAIIMNKEL